MRVLVPNIVKRLLVWIESVPAAELRDTGNHFTIWLAMTGGM